MTLLLEFTLAFGKAEVRESSDLVALEVIPDEERFLLFVTRGRSSGRT
jgi:hypothetical protein